MAIIRVTVLHIQPGGAGIRKCHRKRQCVSPTEFRKNVAATRGRPLGVYCEGLAGWRDGTTITVLLSLALARLLAVCDACEGDTRLAKSSRKKDVICLRGVSLSPSVNSLHWP